jgi:hypothetical protein
MEKNLQMMMMMLNPKLVKYLLHQNFITFNVEENLNPSPNAKLNEEYFIKNSTLTFKCELGFFVTGLQGPRRFFILFLFCL